MRLIFFYRASQEINKEGNQRIANACYQTAQKLAPEVVARLSGRREEVEEQHYVSPRLQADEFPAENTTRPKYEISRENLTEFKADILNKPNFNPPAKDLEAKSNNENLPVLAQKTTLTQKTVKKQILEFKSYYSGKEPFLQNCYSPLCLKIIFNNFGISYALDNNYNKAEGFFKECLKIDEYFKPAEYNLFLLKDLQDGRAVLSGENVIKG